MDAWLPAHLAADGANGPYTTGYMERDDIPFQFALAENFTICDNYHRDRGIEVLTEGTNPRSFGLMVWILAGQGRP